jgi:PIN domain nuclease of toxin-antitoxin system
VGHEPVIVLDTHALIWWLSNTSSLTPKARRAIAKESRQNGIVVSAISVFEISTLCRRSRLQLSVPVETWLADARRLPELRFEPVTADIAQFAGSFGDDMHGDPADRIIAATTIVLNAPLVTADTKLRAYKGLDTIW